MECEKMNAEAFKKLKVKDVMEAPVSSDGSASLGEINTKLLSSPSEMVGVVSGQKLEGIVTGSTLKDGLLANKINAASVMRQNPTTINMEGTVNDAIELMDSRGFDKLPVVDNSGDFVGVVSKKSLLRKLSSEITLTY
jgi:CBS domain-containing protein